MNLIQQDDNKIDIDVILMTYNSTTLLKNYLYCKNNKIQTMHKVNNKFF